MARKEIRMRILMVISQFDPIIGGAEKQAKLLAKKLAQKGIQVKILTGWWKFGTPHSEVIDGIKIFRNFSFWGMFGMKGFRFIGALVYVFTLAFYLLIHRQRYELIHVHQVLYPAFVSILIGKKVLGKPVIVKTASSGMTSDLTQLKKYPFGHFQANYLLKEMDCLVAVSQISGKEFIKAGYPVSQIIYIPNGVEISSKERRQTREVKHVISTVRLSREKGIDVLLEAWAKVVLIEGNVKLIVLGGGPLEVEMKKKAYSLGIYEYVNFKGFVDSVTEYYRDADLFVLPSRAEGMSNALLEAMSYGMPCIATKVGGNGEVLGGEEIAIPTGEFVVAKNGLLVNPDDKEGLCAAILYLIQNSEKREEMGRRCRGVIEGNYSINLIADRYIHLYRSMLNMKA
jgi:glycosyltransferase involved in cell wall biosynthesis